MREIIDYLGFKSYKILFWLCVLILAFHAKYNLLFVYVLFYYLCVGVVKILKPLLRSPRPPAAAENSRPGSLPFLKFPAYLREDLSGPVEKWGMPSGHASSTLYSILFMWWAGGSLTGLKRDAEFAFFVFAYFVAAAMFYQRWWYEKHTIGQLFFGAVLGASFGYFAVWAFKRLQDGGGTGAAAAAR